MEIWMKPFNEIIRSYNLNPNTANFGYEIVNKNISPSE